MSLPETGLTSTTLSRRTLLGAVGLGTAGLTLADWAIQSPAAHADVLGRGAASPTGLADIIVDQVGRIEPAFDPAVTSYTATAYRSVTALTVRGVTVGGATVTINGKAPDVTQHDRVSIPVTVGSNRVTVAVTKAGVTTNYTVNVTKVDTDYRGRQPVPFTVSTKVGSAADHPLSAITDEDPATYWAPEQPIKAGPGGDEGVTAVVLDLQAPRLVGLITGLITHPKGQWYPAYKDATMAIEASTDQQEWDVVTNSATLQENNGSVYWEFNRFVECRYLRISLSLMDDRVAQLFGINWLRVLALPVGTLPPPRFDPPADGGQQHAFVPQGRAVGRAQELALHYGLVAAMWAPSSGFAAGSLNTREYKETGELTAQFYDPPLEDVDFMANSPKATWGIAKAPAGGNGIGDAGEPRAFLPEKMAPYASRMIDLQFGDEGGYSTAEVEAYRKWFAFARTTYPQAITHSNQNNNGTWAANFSYYVKTAQPDLASFDNYYWWFGVGPVAWKATSEMLGNAMWKAQRQAALEGLTGDGSQPILFGQYLDAFATNGSQSQQAIVTSLSLASGMKWLSWFRMEMNRFDGTFYFDVDGAPTRAYWELGALVHQVRTLGRYLVALNNQWIAVSPGQHREGTTTVSNPTASGWRLDSAARSGTQLADWGIAGVSAVNTGTTNNGLPGDVAIGLFDTLPRLEAAEAKKLFGTATPKAFVVTNCLLEAAEYATSQQIRYDNGQFWQTAQQITLEVVPPPTGTLMRVDPITGNSSQVKLRTEVTGKAQDKVTRHFFTTNIGGGLCELYYWTSSPLQIDTGGNRQLAIGQSAKVTVTVSNPTPTDSKLVTVKPTAPDGWSVSYTGATKLGAVPAKGSISFTVTIGNLSSLQTASIPLGITVGSAPIAAAVQVEGVPAGTLQRPTFVAVDSEEVNGENGRGANAVDGNTSTIWHTEWAQNQPPFPHWIVVDLGAGARLGAVTVTPRQDASSQRLRRWQIFLSDDPTNFPATPAATGEAQDLPGRQLLQVSGSGRYLKLVGLDAWGGSPFLAISELGAYLS